MICKYCGKEVDSQSPFCSFCGARQDQAQSKTQSPFGQEYDQPNPNGQSNPYDPIGFGQNNNIVNVYSNMQNNDTINIYSNKQHKGKVAASIILGVISTLCALLGMLVFFTADKATILEDAFLNYPEMDISSMGNIIWFFAKVIMGFVPFVLGLIGLGLGIATKRKKASYAIIGIIFSAVALAGMLVTLFFA